jgi:hypothetical protein
MRRGLRRALAFARFGGRVTLGPRRLQIGLSAVEHPTDPPLPTGPIPLRAPCVHCGARAGTVVAKACNACVYCATCRAFQYNAPHAERRAWLRTPLDRPHPPA